MPARAGGRSNRQLSVNGGVAERFKAPVLKTGNAQAFVSSNLTASAINNYHLA